MGVGKNPPHPDSFNGLRRVATRSLVFSQHLWGQEGKLRSSPYIVLEICLLDTGPEGPTRPAYPRLFYWFLYVFHVSAYVFGFFLN